jgi:hypothetical protein
MVVTRSFVYFGVLMSILRSRVLFRHQMPVDYILKKFIPFTVFATIECSVITITTLYIHSVPNHTVHTVSTEPHCSYTQYRTTLFIHSVPNHTVHTLSTEPHCTYTQYRTTPYKHSVPNHPVHTLSTEPPCTYTPYQNTIHKSINIYNIPKNAANENVTVITYVCRTH